MADRGQVSNPAFDLNAEPPALYAFIQWKGTDVCMDFHCECGAYQHIDGMFVYSVKCDDCGVEWEMPSRIFPRRKSSDAVGQMGKPNG